MSQPNLETVQNIYRAFGAGDMDAFFSHIAEDATWESRYSNDVPIAGVYSGKGAIKQLLGSVHMTFEIHAFVPEKLFSDDDTVVSLGFEEVTVKSTGIRYRNNWVHVFSFGGGKVQRVQTSNDTAAAQAAFNPA